MSARHATILLASLQLLFSCSDPQDVPDRQTSSQEKAYSQAGSTPAFADSSRAGRLLISAEQLVLEAKYDSAIVNFEYASEVFAAKENWHGYVRCLWQIGFCLTEKTEFARARLFFDRALETGKARLGEHHIEVGRSYFGLGWLLWRQGDLDQAYDFLDRALTMQVAMLGPEHPEVGETYHAIGNVFQYKGDHDRALSFKERALAILLAAHGEQYAPVADVYNSMAIEFAIKSDYTKALEYFQKALSVWRLTLGELHAKVSFAYHNMGGIYTLREDYEQAIANFEKSFSIKLTTFGERNLTTLISKIALIAAYAYNGDYQKARRTYEEVMPLAKSVLGERHLEFVRCYENLGILYRLQGNYDEALVYYQRALSIQRQLFGKKSAAISETANQIALAHFQKGDYDRALEALRTAINANLVGFDYTDPWSDPPLDNIIWEAELLKSLSQKASVLAKRYTKGVGELRDLQHSVSTFDHIMRLIEKMRSGYRAEGSKLNLAKSTLPIFESAIQTTLTLSHATGDSRYLDNAFVYAEKSKAGILLEAFSEVEAKQFANIPDSLREQEHELRIELTFHERNLIREQLQGAAGDSTKIAEWRDRMFELEREYETLLERLERDFPDYYDLKYQVNTASMAEVQSGLLTARSALIEYFAGEDSIFVFAVTPEAFQVKSMARGIDFKNRIDDLRQAIAAGNITDYTEAAAFLFEKLLAPVLEDIDADHIIIIPDGVISAVPFEALLTHPAPEQTTSSQWTDLPYLIKKIEVSYAYSATLLLETLKRKRAAPAKDFLAFAPVFAGGLPAQSRGGDFFNRHIPPNSTRSGTPLASYLPASQQEITDIRDTFQQRYGFWDRIFGARTQVQLERDATEARLKSRQTQDFRFLHLATHGFVNAAAPELSGLLLSEEDSQSTEDGILYLGEIYTLNLNADLVVLSACETGLGQIARGEGIIGLTRGFLYAGARNLLVSLWQVSDNTTADLMVNFYERMLAGASRAEALRQAKLDLIQSHPEYAKPFYWAPFVLVGR